MQFEQILYNYLVTRNYSPSVLFKFSYSSNETHDDFSTKQLISLASYFICGINDKNISLLHEFINISTDLKIITNAIIKLVKNVKNEIYCRDAKFALRDYKLMFEGTAIDFDNREWVIEMLNYLYVVADEEIMFIGSEKRFEKENVVPEMKKEKLKVMNIDADRSLLRRFNEPTMSVDDYVNKIMKLQENVEYIEIKIDEDEERKKLEKKEDERYGAGNTGGRG